MSRPVAAASPAAPRTCSDVLSPAFALLDQCSQFVRTLPDTVYVAPSETLPGGTVGKHVRHLLDHYAAVISPGAEIDYDHRERDVPMETDRSAAVCVIGQVRDRLSDLAARPADEAVTIRVMLTSMGDCASLGSTLAREVAFATHHAVHHLAMIRAIAGEFGIEPPAGFGVAPSTLRCGQARAGAPG